MTTTPPRIGFISLGCPKNLVDSERIITQLRSEGYELSASYQAADLVVINTCGFIDAAVEESLETIAEALAENGRVIVTGCLGARADSILHAYPQVLAVSGAHAYEEVMQAVHQHAPPPLHPGGWQQPPGGIKLTPRHYAYLKIAEGCSHSCSFCIIPQLRGNLVSRPLDEIMLEAEQLASAGVRELLLVSQDTGAYGQDIRHRTAFWKGRPLASRLTELAKALGELGIWIRLHYLYPYKSLDELIPLMAEGQILPYMDIPLQHADPAILKAMRRPAAGERMLERIAAWRADCPQLTIRSTFIVGFPGESEEDFDRLLAFLEEAGINRAGCFEYSDIEGAASRELPNKVDPGIIQERMERFMAQQQRISERLLEQRIGSREIVLVDENQGDHIIARSAGDAPEIDGQVIIDGEWDLDPGDFVEVEIIHHDHHDLHARIPEEPEE